MNDKEAIPVTRTASERLMYITNLALEAEEDYRKAVQEAHDKAVVAHNKFDDAVIAVVAHMNELGETTDMVSARNHLILNRDYMKDMVASYRTIGAKHEGS